MMPWTRSREAKRRLDEIQETLDRTDAIVVEQQSHVNALVSWLNLRSQRNGFGEDFELTITIPRQRGNHG